MVAKINEDLEETEFQVEIPESESLNSAGLKCVKVKIVDQSNTELVSHYFYPDAPNVHNLQIPEACQKNLKSQKLIIACKETKNMLWEANRHKTDLSFVKLNSQNEIVKEVKFDKVKFEVVVRIRQALTKRETHEVETSKTVLNKVHIGFDQFEKRSVAGGAPSQPV